MLSKNHFTLPFYIPRICSLWSNWPEYLFNYVSGASKPAEYRMRSGVRLIDDMGALPGTMAVVFVRQEYGQLERFRTIVDVGAHMGMFAVHAAQSCPEARVYCYEPDERNFALLTRNISVNGLEGRVTAYPHAVASSLDPRDLAIGESLANSFHIIPDGAVSRTVNCTTIKEIFATHQLETIDLLKMNCEGSEYEILENCSDDEFRRIANIRLEYHNLTAPRKSGESLSRFLEAQGYRIERFTRYLNTSGFIWAARGVLVTLFGDSFIAFA